MAVQSRDSTLRRAVFLSLCSDPSVQTRSISVRVQDGLATVSGWVTSNVQKSAAIAAARRVANVCEVIDAISVALPSLEAEDSRSNVAEGRSTLSLASMRSTG